jgi:hypothetical protein
VRIGFKDYREGIGGIVISVSPEGGFYAVRFEPMEGAQFVQLLTFIREREETVFAFNGWPKRGPYNGKQPCIGLFSVIRRELLEQLLQLVYFKAPNGQTRTHFWHSVHLSVSTAGALKPSCISAPTGQALAAGQAWSCGQRALSTMIMLWASFFMRWPF